MALINSNQLPALFRPGLNSITGHYATYPPQWKAIYKTLPSFKNFEQDVEMKYTGPAVVKPEGQATVMDSMGQRVITTYVHKRISLGFEITKEAIEDNLYQTEFPMKTLSLANSIKTTENILGAIPLNEAFNANVPVGDGQSLCSIAHPIDNGTFSNRVAVPSALTETSLEQMIILIQKFQMQSGMLAQTMPKKLIVSRENQFNASRLLNSRFRTNTANNDISALYNDDYIPEGYHVFQYLLSPTAYYIITDAPDGFKHFERTALETDAYVDFATDNVMCKVSKRLSFGVTNPRAVCGNPGA